MTYDILFVPRRPGQPWEQALDEAEALDDLDVPLGPQRRQQWERIVEVLRRRAGEVEVAVAEEALEATTTTGLQVSLFADEAALSFPCTERDDRQAFHDLVVDLVGLVEGETGLSAWDAQTDEPFDGRVHDGQGLAVTRRPGPQAGDGATGDAPAEPDHGGVVGPDTGPVAVRPGAGATATDGPAQPGQPAPDDARLADLRRRAQRYIGLGALIVAVSLVLRGQEEPSLLSGLALAVGVADLVIGALMYRSWRRATAGR